MTKPFRLLFRLMLLAALTCLSISFTVGNQQQILLSLPPSSVALNIPVYLFGGIVFSTGLMFGIVSALLYYYRNMARLQRNLRSTQKDVAALRQQAAAEKTEAAGQARLVQRYGLLRTHES